MKTTFSCFVVGEGSLTIHCSEILRREGHDVRGVVASNPEMIAWAGEKGIPVIDRGASLLPALRARPFDYLFSIVNMRVLSDEIVDLPKRGAINFHDGPLPRYAGVHATSWALMARERSHAITWHTIGRRIDGGQILLQRPIDIAEQETAFTLNTKCFEAGTISFTELVQQLSEGTTTPRDQDFTQRSYFGMYQRPPAACVISWDKPADETVAFVRALEFGSAPNPLGRAKLALGPHFFICPAAERAEAPPGAVPGTVLGIAPAELRIATTEGALVFRELLTLDGSPVTPGDAAARSGIKIGSAASGWDEALAARATALNSEICRREASWAEQLGSLLPPSFAYLRASSPADPQRTTASLEMTLPAGTAAHLSSLAPACHPGEFLLAAFAAYVERLSGESEFDLGVSLPPWNSSVRGLEALFAASVPLRLKLDSAASFERTLKDVRAQLAVLQERKTFLRDLPARYPELGKLGARGLRQALPLHVACIDSLGSPADDHALERDGVLHLLVPSNGQACRWVFDSAAITEKDAQLVLHQFTTFLSGLIADPSRPLAQLPLLTESETQELIRSRNATEVALPPVLTTHGAFEQQVLRSPDSVAVVCRDEAITYRELDARANQLARHLRKLGVGPDVLVAVTMERSVPLVVALMGILKAGGAYVPLDPSYPAERIGFMLEDSRAPVILTQESLRSQLPEHRARAICLDTGWEEIARESAEPVESAAQGHHLAYVIYTSGSTGKPKGVMVEHRNVVNFFCGMDQRIGSEPGVWLAVTSISFDISVLELFWTLARGFKVVLVTDEDRLAVPPSRGRRNAARGIDFSLFYFASELGGDPRARYRLLLEGAKFGDQNGFSAVWTPERHFHSFGGLYPNPSVASAALAALTSRIAIRAGSVVSPLHHPVRIAEEWSLVDNLSGGRVGISFASGWQPNDFVLAPARFADRKRIMYEDIDIIRRLWRGETVMLKGGDGREVPVKIFPPPLQPELPFWVTAAGNPETFRQAGASGANILTHLLGQKFEDVEAKIRVYREARAAAGHPGRGHATLMLHTFVGDSIEAVRAAVREPMCRYLGTSLDLIRDAPFAFPTFKVPSQSVADKVTSGLKNFSPEEMQVLLGFAFDRYFDTSSFFGTVDRCVEIAEQCKACDVDEIGCLIDFGVPVDQALNGLNQLNEVRQRSNRPTAITPKRDYSIQSQIEAHGVTHLQCTPSLARMIADQSGGIEVLAGLRRLMLGGEALPQDLLSRLRKAVRGEIHNMYGPTETTIWSTTDRLPPDEDFITIGRPIANTQVYVMDRQQRLVPAGLPGELLIGGDGVARGYLNREDLTRDRFLPDPFRAVPGARLYRTGDLVAWRADGRLDFLGRLDNQVKIRGHRIELGEIELALAGHPRVATAVVVPRVRASGEADLAAFYTTRVDGAIELPEFRELLARRLPDYMIPASALRLDKLPTTPNGKIDRKSLAAMAIDSGRSETPAAESEPRSELEQQVAAVFSEALELNAVSIDARFFDLGANSLTLVRVAARLAEQFPGRVSLVDLFQHTTIRLLAGFLSKDEAGPASPAQAQRGSDRGRRRRESLLRRQG